MSRQTNESLSTAMISLQLPRVVKSRPSSCRTSFLFPKRSSRPSSSLEPGRAVRMSSYSVNSSESSGGSSNSESGASPQGVQSGRSRDTKPAVINFELTALRCEQDVTPSHWYQLPSNLPPLKRPRRTYRQVGSKWASFVIRCKLSLIGCLFATFRMFGQRIFLSIRESLLSVSA